MIRSSSELAANVLKESMPAFLGSPYPMIRWDQTLPDVQNAALQEMPSPTRSPEQCIRTQLNALIDNDNPWCVQKLYLVPVSRRKFF